MKMNRTALAVLAAVALSFPCASAAQNDAVYEPAASLAPEHIPPIPMSIIDKAQPYT